MAGRPKGTKGLRRSAIVVRGKDGRARRSVALRAWPHDTLDVGEWYIVKDPRKFQTAKNSAYQYGQRAGKTFQCVRYAGILEIERIA